MVFSLSLLQHRLHALGALWLADQLPQFIRNAIQQAHSNHVELTLYISSRDEHFDLLKALEAQMRMRDSGFLFVGSREGTPGQRCLVAHKFSPLLQYQSVIIVRTADCRLLTSGKHNAVKVSVSSVSCSIIPPWVPLSFLLAALLFWLPFPDLGANASYVCAFHRQILSKIPSIGLEQAAVSLKEDRARGIIGREESDIVATGTVQPSLVFFVSFILLPVLSIAYGILFLS